MLFEIRRLLLTLAPVLAACVGGCATDETAPTPDECFEGKGKCDLGGGDDDVCAREGRYQDGTCDSECGLPDLDCFMFFDDDAGARAWFAGWEAAVAAQLSRPPRATVAADDPRVVKMRGLLDVGWEAYASVLPVGQLDRAPGLVVIEDKEVNAFVASDHATQKAAWTVMVQTGLLDKGATDDEILGVVMHELTHAVKLHTVKAVPDRIRKHYQVFPGEAEPLGSLQADEPVARAAISAWRELGNQAGPYPRPELNGVPVGQTQLLAILMVALLERGKAADPQACAPAAALATELKDFLTAKISAVDGDLRLAEGDAATVDEKSRAFLAALRDQCLAGSTTSFIDLAASHFGIPAAAVEEGLSPEDRALIEGRHVVDQITALTSDRYRRMREVAAQLVTDTGADVTSLRYYSSEEAADDSTVPVLAAAGFPADGAAEFFFRILPDAAASECRSLIAAGTIPPYGPLTDEHHGTCWRALHIKTLASGPRHAANLSLIHI